MHSEIDLFIKTPYPYNHNKNNNNNKTLGQCQMDPALQIEVNWGT